MANIKSAQKRIDVAERNRDRNKAVRSEMKTQIKKFTKAIVEGDAKNAEAMLPQTFEIIDKAAQKGAIHKNQANRRKGILASELNSIKSKKKTSKKD